jgi:hypothetical protein
MGRRIVKALVNVDAVHFRRQAGGLRVGAQFSIGLARLAASPAPAWDIRHHCQQPLPRPHCVDIHGRAAVLLIWLSRTVPAIASARWERPASVPTPSHH